MWKRYKSYAEFLADIGEIQVSEEEARAFIEQSKTLKRFKHYVEFEGHLLDRFEEEFPEYKNDPAYDLDINAYMESLMYDGDLQVVARMPDGRVLALWLEDCKAFDKEVEEYFKRRVSNG